MPHRFQRSFFSTHLIVLVKKLNSSTQKGAHMHTHTSMHHEWFSLKTLHKTCLFSRMCFNNTPYRKAISEKNLWEFLGWMIWEVGKEIKDVTTMIFEQRKEMVVIINQVIFSTGNIPELPVTRECQVKRKLNIVSITRFLQSVGPKIFVIKEFSLQPSEKVKER